jgi:hypothetical protein
MVERENSPSTTSGQRWLKCFMDNDKRGLHVWHGKPSGGTSQPKTGDEQSLMEGI